MRNDQERRALSFRNAPEQCQHTASSTCIQTAGRLVGQHEGRVQGQCPCDGDPLPLSATEFIRRVVGPGAQPDSGKRSSDTATALPET